MIPGSASQFFLGASQAAGGATGFQVSRSLRFNSSDSAYLSRTPAVAGNRKTWTWAGWVKRSELGTLQTLFGVNNGSGNDYFAITLNTSDSLSVTNDATQFINTAQVFRDAAAWMHLVFAVNTANATASDRIILYVNGTRVTSFANTSYPTQNTDLAINSAVEHGIGRVSPGRYFNGYLAEVFFIDGQALTPSSFTEVSATTGQLIPKAYSGGSYGTNGFYLQFADNSSNTAATLGKDTSGNSNNWTPNNFSVVGSVNAITIPASNAPPTVDYLVVGGGGGGGGGPTNTYSDGGGGGAGGLRSTVTATGGGGTLESPLAVVAGNQYTVTVGAGGATGNVGENGGNSVFGSITSTGGGGGGTRLTDGVTNNGSSGGSGGGAAIVAAGGSSGSVGAGTANQGYAGGLASGPQWHGGGAGGGAGAVGGAGSGTNGGTGGAGVAVSITGSSVTYAGGGGGGIRNGTGGNGGAGGGGAGGGNANGTAGATNTGGGGGGGAKENAVSPGGAGGSGIVVIRYANTYADLTVGGGLTYTYANTGGYKIYSFTASATASQSAGNDSLVDTPTSYGTDTGVGGEVRGNYCTLNPLNQGTSVTLSNGNLDVLIASGTGPASYRSAFATIGMTSGKWYSEMTVGALGSGGDFLIGISKDLNGGTYIGATSQSWGYEAVVGAKYNNNTGISAGYSTYTTGDTVLVAFDADNGRVFFGKNGVWQESGNPATGANAAYTGLTSGPYFFGGSTNNSQTINANFGQRAFAYTAPSGFKALCDTNLGAPVVAKPNTLMDVALYTGNGSTQTISGLNFSPDLVWCKSRSVGNSHHVTDIVRGVEKALSTDYTGAENWAGANGDLTAFTSDGFTMRQSATWDYNGSGKTYVGWAWDAGTTTASNGSGSITSQVRANASAGFSVVTWTGTGANATVGHGLGVAPGMVIVKRRDTTANWQVRHTSIAVANSIQLNLTNAAASATTVWNSTAPSSTVFSIGTDATVNASGGTYVAYCFAPQVGYSSFGTWTGAGTTNDQNFIYTGFRPRFIMVKCTDAGEQWFIFDSARRTYNMAYPDITELRPNSSGAEGSYYNLAIIDFLSNGFKIRGNTGSEISFVGRNYIYACFAENPFQYARAR